MAPENLTLTEAGPPLTMAETLRRQVAGRGDRVFLRFGDETWTFAQAHREACRYANLFLAMRDESRPFHIGVLMDNSPAFVFAELGCALAGAALVGLNPTRTGRHLRRDIEYADCQAVIADARYLAQLRGARADAEEPLPVWVAGRAEPTGGERDLEQALAAATDSDPEAAVDPKSLLLLIFTSGTTKAPKGVINTNQRLMLLGWGAVTHMCGFTAEDTVYCAMPLFHANAQVLALTPALVAGGCIALAPRFSKSRFLDDIRRYGATLFNYVGSPLAYIMDTPEKPDDADNPLRLAYGNEAPRQFIEAFGKRFGCRVVDGYGASEVGVGFSREAGDPERALGKAEGVKILNERGKQCPPARFDEQGRLLNAEEAVGEIVNTTGVFLFEGYYKDEESTRRRTRDGYFYTGDLGYKDDAGYIYFAGRDAEWVRVGGENFLVRPIEEVISRHPDVILVSVYGVPDPEAGDRLMAAVKLRTGVAFDPVAFARFLDGEKDLPPRWRPTFVRVAEELKTTHSNKVLKRVLQREAFLVDRVDDPVYWRPRGKSSFEPFTAADLAEMRERFEKAGYADRLEA